MSEDARIAGLELGENIETIFKVEPPLTPADTNFGYIGVLLRDKIQDKLQCHICGGWFKVLGMHSARAHKTNSASYRDKFSLPKRFPLCSRNFSRAAAKRASTKKHLDFLSKIRKSNFGRVPTKRRSDSMRAYTKTEAYLNTKGLCEKQILSRYLIVADMVGRDPTVAELYKHDCALLSAIQRRYNNSLNNFKRLNNFAINHLSPKENKCSDIKAIGELKKFYETHKRIPRTRDFKNGRTPTTETIRSIFGSWNRALVSAGLI